MIINKLSTFTTIPYLSYPFLSITLQRSKHIYILLLYYITDCFALSLYHSTSIYHYNKLPTYAKKLDL